MTQSTRGGAYAVFPYFLNLLDGLHLLSIPGFHPGKNRSSFSGARPRGDGGSRPVPRRHSIPDYAAYAEFLRSGMLRALTPSFEIRKSHNLRSFLTRVDRSVPLCPTAAVRLRAGYVVNRLKADVGTTAVAAPPSAFINRVRLVAVSPT